MWRDYQGYHHQHSLSKQTRGKTWHSGIGERHW
jgi:hypothetical protein